MAEIRAGDPTPRDLLMPDGRRVRAHCTALEGGGRIITYCDISDLIIKEEQLTKFATTDSLTGLYNRRHFLELCEAEWERFHRYNRPLSLLMVDIDHFKSVNDRYGHAVGDEAIATVGRACISGKRKSDVVGRIGGEEFAILLPETDMAKAEIVATRLCKRVSEQTLMTHMVHFKVTASIGVATASPSMSSFGILMRSADDALYQAKAAGRNRISHWSAPEASKQLAE